MRTDALRLISTSKDFQACSSPRGPRGLWAHDMSGPQQPRGLTHASIHQMEIWSNAAMESRRRRVLYREFETLRLTNLHRHPAASTRRHD